MKRAVVYARFSSDRQRDRSIDDQVALCREFAARQGWTIQAIYADHAASGSTMHRRPELTRMLTDAEARRFDVMLAEDIDRLARGEGDAPKLRERMEFLGVEIHTLADGHVTKLHAGLKGLMSSLFLDNLITHTKRGMAGVVRDGRHAGGRAYGYRPVAGKRGELMIVETEAAIVRRIFDRYLAGDTLRQIAAALNRDGIAPPRGRFWRASTINGNLQRGTGILQNELYTGVIVWNRLRMVRDPNTGRRLSRPNPTCEHQRAEALHLRIIEPADFRAARVRKATRAQASPQDRVRPKRLLSGLLRCGCCSAGMSASSTGTRARIVCTQMREAGSCAHRRSYYLDDIERRVVTGLRAQLGTREAVAYFVAVFNEERRKLSTAARDGRSKVEHDFAMAERELERAISGLVRGTLTETEADRVIPGLRARLDRIADELAAAEQPNVVTLHPAAVDAYLRDIARLDELANADLLAGRAEVATAIRNLITTVTIMPAPTGQSPEIKLCGTLSSLLPPSIAARWDRMPGQVVAGAGFEPATSGL
jgi:site-specific DNA recombinase